MDGIKLGSLDGLVEDVGNDDGCLEGFSDNVSALWLCACCGSAGTGSGGTGSNGAANSTRVDAEGRRDGAVVGFVENEGNSDGCVDGT